jgi:hypothetical protein
MMIPVKLSSDAQAHVDAGHFAIYPKPWMGNNRIWIAARPDGTIITAVAKRADAEIAAIKWYDEQAAQANR